MQRPDDRAFHPNRRVGYDPRPAEIVTPQVSVMGETHGLDDLGWLIQNAEHAQGVHIGPTTGPGAVVTVNGDNHLTGPWEFKASFADRNAARDWFGHERWSHARISDTIRDGGY